MSDSDDEESARLLIANDGAGDEAAVQAPEDKDTRGDGLSYPERDPIHVIVLYSISFHVSLGALIAGFMSYFTIRNGHFSPPVRERQLETYAAFSIGMGGIMTILAANLLWTALNIVLAFRGRQSILWHINFIYDFLVWGWLLALGILATIMALWDRRLCDDQGDDNMAYARCDGDMFNLLVRELVCANMGNLVAVIHFILMIGRCFDLNRDYRRLQYNNVKYWLEREEQKMIELWQLGDRLRAEIDELRAERSRLASEQSTTAGGAYTDQSPELPTRPSEDLIDVSSNAGTEETTTREQPQQASSV